MDRIEVPELELEIRPGGKVAPLRSSLRRALTTIGSDARADIAVAGVPPRWAIVQRDGAEVVLRLLGSGESHRLASGSTVSVAGVELTLHARRAAPDEPGAAPDEAGLQMQGLADRLSEEEDPQQALTLLLSEVMEASGADVGAVILREHDHYTISVDLRRDGTRLPEPAKLLSDHIVRDVLEGGNEVTVADVGRAPRYAQIPSVTLLRLHSVVCVPMRLQRAVLGAIFLGKHQTSVPFTRRQSADLTMVAALAVPLLVQLRRGGQRRAGTIGTEDALSDATDLLVGESQSMQAVRALIERVAPSDLSVLILGQTGTGKELVARAVHQASPRRGRPLIALNCAAVPESLLEAELFGARRGAFTGATTDRVGRIEQAHQSTLFLDELGDMPLAMQAALLRVLEQREVVRLGENTPRKVDFRLIAATHHDLETEVAAGRFRQDLLYRLKEFVIDLPPLARRDADVLLLAQLFLRQTEQQLGLGSRRLSTEAAEALVRHTWPGNIRELRATMRRAAILCDGREIGVEHLGIGGPAPLGPAASAPEMGSPLGPLDRPLADARDEFIARYVAAVLHRHGGDRDLAAQALHISVRSLYRYLKSPAD